MGMKKKKHFIIGCKIFHVAQPVSVLQIFVYGQFCDSVWSSNFPHISKSKTFFLKLRACVASHVDLSVHVEKFTPRYQISLI